MQVDLNIFMRTLLPISKDGRITVWHIALIWGIIQLATNNDPEKPIFISRRQVMHLAHISSFVTYHKCIKELQEFGYIHYIPSYHPGIQSRVFILG